MKFRTVLQRAALAICFPLVTVSLAEFVARAIVGANDVSSGRLFAVTTGKNGERYWQRDPSHPKKWYPPYAEKKPDDVIRIVCIGGSTVEGHPIQEMAFPFVIQHLLSLLKPEQKFEVLGAGVGGQYSAGEVEVLHEVVDLKPDLIVLYSAHNEFHPKNVGALMKSSEHPVLGELTGIVEKMALRRLVLRSFHVEPVVQVNESIKDKAPDHRPIDGKEYGLVLSAFRDRLNEFVDVCERRDIGLVLCTSVSNMRDFPPMADVYRADLSREDREKETALIAESIAASKARDFQHALDLAEQAAKIDATPAGIYYARGKALDGLERFPEAKEQYRLARDYDGRVNRATTELNAIVREVADKTPALLADVENRFAEASPQGIVGRNWILDNVHPSVEGQAMIARVVIETLGAANNLITKDDLKRLPAISKLTGQPSVADSEERIGFSNLLLALEEGRPGETADVARFHFENSLKTETRAGALLGIALLDALDGKTKEATEGMKKAFKTQPSIFANYAESARKSVFVEKLFRASGVRYDGDKAVLAAQ